SLILNLRMPSASLMDWLPCNSMTAGGTWTPKANTQFSLNSTKLEILKTGWRRCASGKDGVTSISRGSTSGIPPTRSMDMSQEQSRHDVNREGWTGLVNSVIGFTNAATMFSFQQFLNSFRLFTDSRHMVNRYKRSLDSLS